MPTITWGSLRRDDPATMRSRMLSLKTNDELIDSIYLILKKTYPSMQWAAVKMVSSEMIDPPQLCRPRSCKETCQGNWSTVDTFPPIIRMLALGLVWDLPPA